MLIDYGHTKIFAVLIQNPKVHKKVQLKLFSLGYTWASGITDIYFTEEAEAPLSTTLGASLIIDTEQKRIYSATQFFTDMRREDFPLDINVFVNYEFIPELLGVELPDIRYKLLNRNKCRSSISNFYNSMVGINNGREYRIGFDDYYYIDKNIASIIEIGSYHSIECILGNKKH